MSGEQDACCDRISARVRGCIASLFVSYGRFAYKRPWASLLLSCVFVLACVPGFALLSVSNEEMNHYLVGSYSVSAYAKTNDLFPFNPGKTAVFMYFTAKSGRNLFSAQALKEIGKAMDRIYALKTPAGEVVQDFCEKSWRSKCEFASLFHNLKDQGPLMGVNMTMPLGSSMGEMEFLADKLATFCSSDSTLCRDFLEPQLNLLLVAKNVGETTTLVVDSLVVITYLDPTKTDSAGGKSSEEYQQIVLEEVHGPSYEVNRDNLQTDNFYTINFSRRTVQQEGARPATAEGHLMGLTFVVIVIFVCCSIVSPNHPRSRILLSLSCTLVVGLSLACAMALSAYVAVPLTSMTSLVIFTLFGVSVDDIIVIVHYFDRTDPNKTNEDRLTQSLTESGTAITLTSTTSLVAFLCAATCPIPSIRYFCITASFGILSVYILQITFFLPLFILDERRRSAMRRECCLSLCFGLVPEPGAVEEKKTSFYDRALQCITTPSVGGGYGIMGMYAKSVSTNRFAQAGIVAAFVLMTGLGIVGSAYADTDGDLTDYYIDSSFMKEYFKMQRELWSSPTPVSLNIKHQDEGLFSDIRRAEIDDLYADLAAQDFTFPPESHWLRDFDTWLNLTTSSPSELIATRESLQGDAARFGAKVAEFLDVSRVQIPGSHVPLEPWRHKKDVVLEDGKVKYSRLLMNFDSDFRVQAVYIKNWRTTYDMFFPDGHGDDITEGGRVKHVWVDSGIAPAADRDGDMREIIFSNLGIACAAVAATVMIMLNPLVGLFVGFLVMSLDAMVLALLTAYGTKLDFVAFLCLSMTIGLVVDYATHTSHAYLHHEGTPDEKLYHCIREMGASVLSGGGSTLLGIGVLGFASSKAFRNFFYVLGTAIFMGTTIGIVVSPVLLRCLHGAGLFLASKLKAEPGQTKVVIVESASGQDGQTKVVTEEVV